MPISRFAQSQLLLALGALVSVSSTAEARRWRYHGSYGYYGYYDRSPAIREQASKQTGQSDGFGATVAKMIRACEGDITELKNTPFEIIARTVRPNASQQDALDEVRSATIGAADTLSSTCPKDVSAMPSHKIDSLSQALEAMRNSRASLLPSITKFYTSLDDEQKARIVLNISAAPSPLKSDQPYRSSSTTGDDGQAPCREWAVTLRSWPTKQIEMELNLSDAQYAALYDVTAAMYRAAAELMMSCPNQGYLTTIGRLDTQQKQLEALRRGMNTTQPVLAAFENLLNADQKTRLRALVGSSPESTNQSARR
jgi:hypothetical protein